MYSYLTMCYTFVITHSNNNRHHTYMLAIVAIYVHGSYNYKHTHISVQLNSYRINYGYNDV